ncbi:MAG: DNA repair protein RadC [Burkholderiales bacterium]
MGINEWPIDERPRERLLAKGAGVLSDAELLAIFLRTGVRGKSAVELGRDLLARFNGVNGAFAATVAEFSSIPGLGPAKYAQLQAAFELARRALGESMRVRDVLDSPQSVRDYLRLALANRPYEAFMVLYLDAQNRVIASEELFRGTLTQTSVYPREVVRAALRHNAAAIIVSHNHPSGVAEPSQADRLLTTSLGRALELVDIKLLDHLIVAGQQVISFAERGLMQ